MFLRAVALACLPVVLLGSKPCALVLALLTLSTDIDLAYLSSRFKPLK